MTTKRTALLSMLAPLLVLSCGDTLDDPLGGAGSGGSGSGSGGPTFTSIYGSDEFQECSGCHAPNAPGITEGIEETQNWSTRATAYNSLQRNASGLIGNNEGCNGVPFLGDSAEESLLVAAFDEDVRVAYDNPSFPDCNADAIADQTLKIGGPLPASLLADLKAWVDAGAPNN
ncbi:MAG: hypothetical protein ABW217_14260 [Polyangiaceae bacterium]